jgi:hypothetical protein
LNVILKNLLLLIASALLMLGLTEGALQALDFPARQADGWKWSESPYRSPSNNDDHRVNELGLRGQPIRYAKDDFVVILLGDSQVEAGTQPHDKMPEALLREALERRLGPGKVKVFSVASAGWGNDQQLVWLKRYFESYRADLVVNWLTPVNDYWENTFIERSITPQAGRLKPTYKLDPGGALILAKPGSRWKLRSLVSLAIGKWRHGNSYTLEQHDSDAWLAALPPAEVPRQDAAACPAHEIDQKALIGSYMQGGRAYTVITDEDLHRGRSHFAVFLKESSQRDRYAVDVTHRLLAEASRTAEAHGARFLLYHAYRSDLDAAFREIKCLKTADGATFAFDGSDWLRYLKASPLASHLVTAQITSDHSLSAGPNDWHFNEEGNRKAMDALADLLVARVASPAAAGKP